MKEFKNKKRLTGVQHRVMGTGTFTVDVPFLPDYLTASYLATSLLGDVPRGFDGMATSEDFLYWALTAVSKDAYTFTVHYSCAHPRDVKWIVAKLPKNAEILAH